MYQYYLIDNRREQYEVLYLLHLEYVRKRKAKVTSFFKVISHYLGISYGNYYQIIQDRDRQQKPPEVNQQIVDDLLKVCREALTRELKRRDWK
jgi:hypothetical protein